MRCRSYSKLYSKFLHKQWTFTGSFVTKDSWKNMRSSSLPTLQHNFSTIISSQRKEKTHDIYRWVHAYVHIVIMMRYLISQVWREQTFCICFLILPSFFPVHLLFYIIYLLCFCEFFCMGLFPRQNEWMNAEMSNRKGGQTCSCVRHIEDVVKPKLLRATTLKSETQL